MTPTSKKIGKLIKLIEITETIFLFNGGPRVSLGRRCPSGRRRITKNLRTSNPVIRSFITIL